MDGVKWISVSTDILNDEKMCIIESMPDGRDMELVWFKLLCLAGKCNENGLLMLSKEIPYTIETMARYFRMDISLIQRSLDIFQSLGMVEIVDDVYALTNWMKYQSNTELNRIKELNKARQKKFRERRKLLLTEKSNVTDNVTDNVKSNVTECVISNDFCSICNMSYVDVYRLIINYLNQITKSNYKYTSKKTQALIHARTEEGFTIDDFKKVIDKKYTEWNGTEFAKYLRPETLFGPKFEGYLNQQEGNPPETRQKTDWRNI